MDIKAGTPTVCPYRTINFAMSPQELAVTYVSPYRPGKFVYFGRENTKFSSLSSRKFF
jgi:hypothetical protein